MRYSIPLLANQPTRQPLRGKCVLIKGTGAAPVVTLELVKGSEQDVENFGEVERNFSLYDADGGGFSGLILTATVNATIDVIVTNYDARARDGDAVTATLDASQVPLPVATTRGGAPGTPFFVTGLTYTDTPAAANANAAAVAMGAAVALIAAANASRLELRITNLGTVPVALGAAGLTWAQRCIVLQPGDTWIEQKGAALAWYGITEAAASSVTYQALTS